jgi:hypothetical protein
MPRQVKNPPSDPEPMPTLKRQKAIKPVAPTKKPSALDAWRSHLSNYRKENPTVSLKQAMQNAKQTYRK